MMQIENVSRRGFLKGVVGTGALVLGAVAIPKVLRRNAGLAADGSIANAALQPNVYLAIATDGTVYIVCHRSEMGSGNRTGLPRIVADELDADWSPGEGSASRRRCEIRRSGYRWIALGDEVSSTPCAKPAQVRG